MPQLKYYDTTSASWKTLTTDVTNSSTLLLAQPLIGTVDGVNKTFTTANNFSTISIYKNGVKMTQGTNADYMVTGSNQIKFNTSSTAPVTGSVLTADYATVSNVAIAGSNNFVTKEIPAGTPNGVITTFSTSQPYIAGTLQVYVNGLAQGRSVTETTPTTGSFTMDAAPLAGDEIEVSYQYAAVTNSNANSVGGYQANDLAPIGATIPFAGINAPSGNWLLAFGQAVSRVTYSALFNSLTRSLGVVTISIASPAVVTDTNHGLRTGDLISFATTGSLPTGLAANTAYYANVIDANTYRISTSRSNSYTATFVTTTGTQSGTHTALFAPYGIGDGATTFNIPDLRGYVPAGKDDMGGTVANRLTAAATGGMRGYNLGDAGGEQAHTLTVPELARVTGSWTIHGQEGGTNWAGISGYATGTGYGGYKAPPGTTGGANSVQNPGFAFGNDTPHNNVQPTTILNYIIKAL